MLHIALSVPRSLQQQEKQNRWWCTKMKTIPVWGGVGRMWGTIFAIFIILRLSSSRTIRCFQTSKLCGTNHTARFYPPPHAGGKCVMGEYITLCEFPRFSTNSVTFRVHFPAVIIASHRPLGAFVTNTSIPFSMYDLVYKPHT